MLSKSIFREVFSNRNILVLSFSALMWAVSNTLWRPYWSLYALELGATKEIVGILSMIESSSLLLCQLPGGMLADRFGRRNVIVYFTAFRILTPVLYFFAPSWQYLIPGLICQSVGSAYMPAYNAIMAESLPYERRGAGYGAYRMMTSLPRTFTVLLGGIIMDSMGLVVGFKTVLVWSSFVAVLVFIVRAKYLRETLNADGPKTSTEASAETSAEERQGDGFSVSKLPKSIWAMIVVACLSSFAVRMAMPFLVVYAVEVVGLTTTEWGLIQTAVGLLSAGLSMPGGMLSDRIGRKPLILASRVISPVSMLGLTFCSTFVHILFVRGVGAVGAGLGGGIWGMMGGPAWQALVADMVPSSRRGRVMGFMATITGVAGVPSSWLGGYLWDNYAPEYPFWLSFIIGIIPIIIFYVFVKEPKNREK